MKSYPWLIPFLKRFFLLLVVSAGLVFSVSELAFAVMRDKSSRGPQQIKLTIPAGTAALVAAGQPAPAIPKEMVFVVGDTLVVKNEDTAAHQLGPLWIPAGTSASLLLDQANDYAYECTFKPSRYFNVTVRQTSTWTTRLKGLWYGTPPTLMFLLVYSFIFFPLAEEKTADRRTPPAA